MSSWEAVGAIGTWVIGGAAIWVARKANSIASQLRQTERERADRAARAVAAGLKIEITNYGRSFRHLADRLEVLISSNPHEVDIPGHSAAAFEQILLFEPSDLSQIGPALGDLPAELSQAISRTFAMHRYATATFKNNVTYMREQQGFKRPNTHEVVRYLQGSVEELREKSVELESILAQLTTFADVP